MLTPFNEDNEPDLKGLAELTEFYIAAGADGLFANCLSSEMFQLTSRERLLITKTVVDTAAGRAPVVATGTFGSKVQANADFIKRIFDTGVAAVVINTNQVAGLSDDDGVFRSNTDALLAQTGEIPLGLYECPVPYKRLLSPELVRWLAETGRFCYLKDTSCNLGAIREKIEAARGYTLGLYNANTPTGLESLKAGASGMSPIGANFYPELYAYLIRYGFLDAGNERLVKVEAFLSIFDEVIDRFYPLSAKLFLKRRGLDISVHSRKQVPALAQEDLLKLDALWYAFNGLAEELGIRILQPESL